MKEVGLEQTLHLSDLILPKGVSLNADISEKSHDLPIVSIHASKKDDSEESEEASAE